MSFIILMLAILTITGDKMKQSKLFWAPIFMLIVMLTTNCYPQTIGKLFTKEEANILYGKTLESVVINSQDLDRLLEKTDNYVMFKLSNNELIVLDDHRNVLSPLNKYLPEDEGVYVFSKSRVKELLELVKTEKVSIENRPETLTITSGFYTLEMSAWCPPFCSDNSMQVATQMRQQLLSD